MTDAANPFRGHEHRRPDVDAVEAQRLLHDAFGLSGELHELGSHQDRNYRVTTSAGERFVLKVARAGLGRDALEAENAAMLHAAAAGLPFAVPVPQPALDGSLIVQAVTAAGDTHDLRLVTWIDGEPLEDFGHLAPSALRAHGAMAARITIALQDFDHPALDRALQWDVRHAGSVVEALAPFASTARAAGGCRGRDGARGGGAVATGAPAPRPCRPPGRHGRQHPRPPRRLGPAGAGRADRLRRPVPDLARRGAGGDVAADTIGAPDRPLHVARDAARGFLPLVPLTDAELEALWPMVVARAAAVAVSGDQQAALEPGNAYVAASRDAEWASLHAVAAVPFGLATEVLREAAGLGPSRRLVVPAGAVPPIAGAGAHQCSTSRP